MRYPYRCADHEAPNGQGNVMKWCQARLSPLGRTDHSEASLDTSEEYMLEVYNEYVERRKF